LYRCVQDHAEELRESGHIHRRVEDETLERFLDCGDLHKGFARVYCDQCGHECVSMPEMSKGASSWPAT